MGRSIAGPLVRKLTRAQAKKERLLSEHPVDFVQLAACETEEQEALRGLAEIGRVEWHVVKKEVN